MKISEVILKQLSLKMWKFNFVFIILAFVSSGQQIDDLESKPRLCVTEGVVCPLTIDNVLDIESNSLMESASGCQYMCFRENPCQNFTFFKNAGGETRCVLFRECSSVSACRRCLTGPARPTSEVCEGDHDEAENEIEAEERTELAPGPEEEFPISSTTTTTTTTTTRTTAPESPALPDVPPTQELRRAKQFDEDAEGGEDDGGDEAADQINIDGIDDGLLDEDEEKPPTAKPSVRDREETTSKPAKKTGDGLTPSAPVATSSEAETVAPKLPQKQEIDEDDEEAFDDDYFEDTVEDNSESEGVPSPNKTSPAFYHCLIGGYGVNGPVPTISHFGSALLHRTPTPLLAPLPSAFPLGDEGMFSTVYSKTLYVCSPGAASTNDQFFSFFGGPTRSLFPGRCIQYSNTSANWEPFGNPMNTFRGGAAFTRMGRFIVATGGRRFPTTLNSIEVLNTAKPQKWRQLSKLTLPNPTYDHCVVAINKTAIFMTGGFGQETHSMMIDMKDKTFSAQEPMKQPRRQHHCQKAQINGRDGVIVAGGSSDVHPALASVEFFDLDMGKWLNLGKLREPRRFPSILVMSNHLLVAGGETTDPLGRTIILDTIEALQGRRWIPLRQRLPEGRSRFVSQRIPKSIFF